ncbi:molybdopterin synthase catalytic subunit [Microbacterium sp. SORGH_AS 1204]|uniref:molybdenum cofactor biosynthesis protein MoaE n=1 Tax=Microbacterium sp. SORGH_AS_1204 TaxID=3041785 RepID=UPI002794A5C1|nr:molybdenum cofactor biosynthesis protein MoaE [Microbacterium sp. SORGH_AS_1204]MDQ1137784.1 molybdopterin synthase catalytic subunit [Microbacterium sp. SORGH_AS_1204]
MTSETMPNGKGDRVVRADVSAEPITVEMLMTQTRPPAAGAVVTFDGRVRDHDEGRGVVALHYSAHPTAGEVIRAVAQDIAARFPDVTLAVTHRTGDLVVGDCALACVVSSAHRREAFAACSELVDLVKERVPIWKEQVFVGGHTEWVNAIS